MLTHHIFEGMFRFSHDDLAPQTPCVIIANHVTNWDPLLVATSFRKHHMYFVASEHLFRKGTLSKIIHFLVAPIARRKGSSGVDTAMACIRHVRQGHSVCVFGEGEVTWDGQTKPVFPGTGMLAKVSGATLITYRLEGGCLSRPRWATSIRKGKMYGRVVGTYSPEQLKDMSTEEVTAIINRDLYEDAFARQKAEPIAYKGKNLAKRIESGLFLCPQCKKIDSLYGKGDMVTCSCGLSTRYTPYGNFEPAVPFSNFQEWDVWQHDCLKSFDFQQEAPLFADENVTLIEILDDHQVRQLFDGRITLEDETLICGQQQFPLGEIDSMAIVQTNILLFSHDKKYYELRTKDVINFRKYLAMWQNIRSKQAPEQ